MEAADLEEIGLRKGGGSGEGDCGEFEGLGGELDRGNQQVEGKESKSNRTH
jgi:hypothetical protein